MLDSFYLQDLSAFAMPLLDTDSTDMNSAEDSRPRSGSLGAGIRNIFRKKHKSGDDSIGSSRGSSPGSTPSKVKSLFDGFRPRQPGQGGPGKPRRASAVDPPTIHEHESARTTRGRSSSVQSTPQNTPCVSPPVTPMSQLLAENPIRAQPGPSSGYPIEHFRHRAYSEPKNTTSSVLRARNAALAKKVCS